MNYKDNALSLSGSSRSLADAKLLDRSSPTAKTEKLPNDILQVTSRLRVSLSVDERVIVVTGIEESDHAHELGKLLTQGLAQLTKSDVVLVDGETTDFRLSSEFAAADSPGFTDVATGLSTLADVTVYPVSLGAAFIPAGRSNQILNAPGCMNVIEELKGKYRFVVLVVSPFRFNPDSLTLATMSDGVVLGLAAGARRKSEVKLFQQTLSKLRLRLIGAVLTEDRSK